MLHSKQAWSRAESCVHLLLAIQHGSHLTLRMSAPTIPTTMEVVVEEDCRSTVDSTPIITPTIGFWRKKRDDCEMIMFNNEQIMSWKTCQT